MLCSELIEEFPKPRKFLARTRNQYAAFRAAEKLTARVQLPRELQKETPRAIVTAFEKLGPLLSCSTR